MGPPAGDGNLVPLPFTFHFHALEKEIATHSSVLAWRIPGMEEPGGEDRRRRRRGVDRAALGEDRRDVLAADLALGHEAVDARAAEGRDLDLDALLQALVAEVGAPLVG